METISNKTLRELQKKLEDERIVFWKEEAHIFLQRKKITFLYSDYEPFNIHVKIMTEDGWLFDHDNKTHKIEFLNKNTNIRHTFLVGEFRRSM